MGKLGHGRKVADGAYVAGDDADFEVPGGLLGETFKRNMFDAAVPLKLAHAANVGSKPPSNAPRPVRLSQ